ncbi:peptidoglycan DD-metalloendopeptidase family protein [Paenibacillus sp. LMG 31456]|uniref:Peptidoglycan DD-metalloendopeptidase family protein n=1 Tax=Paenibacillus foliorum TaxID=2654974 RepID=A0A972K1D0_9BACL|nr:M23 family metallopeptidase [Paenibacillus foliorum]NOU94735.1 peptidoglycan DD-metalloendopeptidase family protein [Paenibacillus foliorum]
MTVFKGMGWAKKLLDKSKQKLSKIQLQRLTAKMRVIPAALTKEQLTSSTHKAYKAVILHKWNIAKTVSVLSVVTAVVWSGNVYVEANMAQIVHVSINGQEVGTVKDKSSVEQFVAAKSKELIESNSDMHVVVKAPEVTFTDERVFMVETSDQEVMNKLGTAIFAQPVGTELVIDGKPVGILKDQATASLMLDQIKSSAVEKKKDSSKVRVLSATPSEPVGEVELQKVDFVQQVELKDIPIQPQDMVNPEELRKKLETGDVQPIKYVVEKGDCVSCVAKKFNIPKQIIYQNNPWIVDDMIKAGQQLDLTVLQPTLAVRTVEKLIEQQEIQYDTEYQKDDSMRLGTDQTIKAGKNGLKKVIILVTKINGLMIEETVQNEEIIQEPVKAVVRKGTKVIKGEGSGKFAWPVVSSSISSTFGYRWGALHKGVDLTSPNKNIMASDNGKVVYAGNKNDGYGNMVILDHLNGYKTLYGHLSRIDVTVGKIVEKGEKIGFMGSTGDSTGVHLHFEVQRSNTPENPLKYLNR